MKPLDQHADSDAERTVMNHETIEQQRIVDRYVMGKLSPEEAEQFEEHYFACPTCFEQVELVDTLHRGLKQKAAQDATATVQRLGLLAWISRRSRALQSAMLLMLLTTIVAPAVFLMQRLEHAEQALLQARQPQINTPFLTLNPERSGSSSAEPSGRIRLSAKPSWIVVALELAAVEHEAYGVTLLDAAGRVVWSADDLHPNPLDALVLTIYSSTLESGDYVFRAEGFTQTGERTSVGHFPFRFLSVE